MGKTPGTKVPNSLQLKWSSGKAQYTTPTNGPGHTPPKPAAPVTQCESDKSMFSRPNYDGAELERTPGLTADRFAAFELPSLVNGVRMPPRRITAMCVGAAGPVAQTGTQRRFTA